MPPKGKKQNKNNMLTKFTEKCIIVWSLVMHYMIIMLNGGRPGEGCQGGRNMYSDNFLKGQFLFIVIQDHVQKSLQQLRFHKGIYLQVRQYKEKFKGTRFF